MLTAFFQMVKSGNLRSVEGTMGVAKPTKVTDNVVWVVVTRPSMWRRGRSSETFALAARRAEEHFVIRREAKALVFDGGLSYGLHWSLYAQEDLWRPWCTTEGPYLNAKCVIDPLL